MRDQEPLPPQTPIVLKDYKLHVQIMGLHVQIMGLHVQVTGLLAEQDTGATLEDVVLGDRGPMKFSDLKCISDHVSFRSLTR